MKKKLISLTIIAIGLLTAVASCQKSKKPTDGATPADSTTTAATLTDEESSVPDYDTTDAVAFGLKGYVKQVITTHYEATPRGEKLLRGKPLGGYADSLMTFNEHGLVTCDSYANPYTYDVSGNFTAGRSKTTKMTRDKKGRITKYDHQIQGEGHWNSYNYQFEYDTVGRIQEVGYVGWEEIFGYKFIFENDEDLWPIKETMEGQACADLFQSETLYRYLKFDDEGNWTEREVWTTEKQGVENGDEEPEMTATNSYTVEKREITYYGE